MTPHVNWTQEGMEQGKGKMSKCRGRGGGGGSAVFEGLAGDRKRPQGE